VKASRIALLTQTYLPDHVGGTEIYVKHLAEGLTARGHEVAVVFHGHPREKMEGQTYQTIALPPFRSEKRVHGFRRARGVPPPGFQRFIDEWKPDFAHFHSFAVEAGPDHAQALTRSKVPYFITYHMPAMTCLRGTLMRWGHDICDGHIDPQLCGACALEDNYFSRSVATLAAKVSVPWKALPEGPWLTRVSMPSLIDELGESWRGFTEGAKHIIACSKWVRDLLLVNGTNGEKITMIRQALPGKTRVSTLRLPCSPRRALRLGYFGRIAPEKGVDLFLKAGRMLHSQKVPIVCEIVGPFSNANLEAFVRQQADESQSWIRYLGTLKDEKLKDWIRSIDLIVIPSRCLETGPLTVLEAWDQGTPVIGTNLAGIREFFLQNGLESLLFEVENPASIAEAIKRTTEWKFSPPSVEVLGLEELLDQHENVYR